MRTEAKYGSAIVITHLAVNIVHGMAHRHLHVGLSALARVFVVSVILVCPLIAMILLWVSQKRLGLLLLMVSMAASFAFGLSKHFLVPGPDHVGEQAPGIWSSAFAATAYLLLLTEALGTFVGVYFLRRKK